MQAICVFEFPLVWPPSDQLPDPLSDGDNIAPAMLVIAGDYRAMDGLMAQ